MRALRCLAAATLTCASAGAFAATWFSLDALSAASGLAIEVDTDSLRRVGTRREIAVRVTYPEPRTHRWGARFRSVTATIEFECEGGLRGYRDAVFYTDVRGTGMIAAREDSQPTAIPEPMRELLPARSVETLTRAACSRPTPAVP